MTVRDARVVEVIAWVMCHAEPVHDGPRTDVRYRGHRDNLEEARALKAESHGFPGGLSGVALAPRMPGQPVADLECRREGRLERLVEKAGEADERACADLFYRPHPEAVLRKARLEPVDERVALLAG